MLLSLYRCRTWEPVSLRKCSFVVATKGYIPEAGFGFSMSYKAVVAAVLLRP